jgi:hypothetical protein
MVKPSDCDVFDWDVEGLVRPRFAPPRTGRRLRDLRAAGEPAVGAADGYWREVMVLRGRLGARVTWRRRLLAQFNVASLRQS